MSGAISSYLPMALGVALSPTAIIAMLILCALNRAKTSGTFALFGWIVGVFGFMVLSVFLASWLTPQDPDNPSILLISLRFLFAFLLLFLAWRSWKTRPKTTDTAAAHPLRIDKLQNLSTLAAFGFGVALVFAAIKNWPIMAAAALDIAQTAPTLSQGITTALLFALISSLGLMIPWLLSILGGEAVKTGLAELHRWLTKYGNTIMAILFLFLGTKALLGAIEALP